jgi:hypothetical protein
MYQCFNPTEMGIVGTMVFAYPHEVIPIFKDDESRAKIGDRLVPMGNSRHFDNTRPYTPIERFIISVQLLYVYKKIRFENAIFNPADNSIKTNRQMDAKREAQSKRIWEAIMNWEVTFLEELSKKYGPILEKMGFQKQMAPALTETTNTSDLERMMAEMETGSLPIAGVDLPPVGETEEEKQARLEVEQRQKEEAALAAQVPAVKPASATAAKPHVPQSPKVAVVGAAPGAPGEGDPSAE